MAYELEQELGRPSTPDVKRLEDQCRVCANDVSQLPISGEDT